MRHLVLTSPLGDPDLTAWTAKFARLAVRGGYALEYWGWDRGSDSGAKPCPLPITRRILVRGGGRRSLRTGLLYPLWMLRVWLAAMRTGPRAMFVTVSFDTGLPVAVASLCRRIRFLHANRDNISRSYRWPFLVGLLLARLERFIANRSSLHLLPGPSRWDKPSPKEHFVPNSPNSDDLAAAKALAGEYGYTRTDEDVFTVYVNGWLPETRGVGIILDALRRCPPDTLRVLVAGKRENCRSAEELVQLPNVTDYGHVSAKEALALYYRSHLVFTYYDPAVAINRVAEPNKWQDCIATGTPFVVNSEVETARPFVEREACVHVPYRDSEALARLLLRLAGDRDAWRKLQSHLAEFTTPAWDVQILGLLAGLPWAEVQAEHG